MRVRNSGGNFGSFGGGENRSDSFRKKHRLGQKVRGKLLKNIADGMAWVSIDDDKLLAQLQNAHPEGARLTFIIKQLVPDIILKEIFEFDAGTSQALGMASSFDAARTLFENKFRLIKKHTIDASSLSRQATFLHSLASDRNLYVAYMDAANCAHAISAQLSSNNVGHILYQPWLVPDSRRQTTFIRSSSSNKTHSLTEVTIEFEHMAWGMVRAEFLHRHPKTGYKLKLQHPSQSDNLKRYLIARTYPGLSTKLECLGVSKLPRSGHGGIIAELMFKTSQ